MVFVVSGARLCASTVRRGNDVRRPALKLCDVEAGIVRMLVSVPRAQVLVRHSAAVTAHRDSRYCASGTTADVKV